MQTNLFSTQSKNGHLISLPLELTLQVLFLSEPVNIARLGLASKGMKEVVDHLTLKDLQKINEHSSSSIEAYKKADNSFAVRPKAEHVENACCNIFPRNPETELLSLLARHPNFLVRANVAVQEKTLACNLSKLSQDADPGVRYATVENMNTPSHDIDRFVLSPDESLKIRYLAAVHPALSENTYHLIVNDPDLNGDTTLLCHLAQNQNCPRTILISFAGHPDENVRAAAASHYLMPEKYAVELLGDCEVVRNAAAANPNLKPKCIENLYKIYSHDEGMLESIACNPSTPGWILKEMYQLNKKSETTLMYNLLCNPATPADVVNGVVMGDATIFQRATVANHKKLNQASLERLVYNGSVDQRLNVINNPNITKKMLLDLSGDNYYLVSTAAIRALDA